MVKVARWQAAATPKAEGIQLEPAADSEWRDRRIRGSHVARLKPSSDYYTRGGLSILDSTRLPLAAWIVIEFLDRGYGLISLSPGVPETEAVGRGTGQHGPHPARGVSSTTSLLHPNVFASKGWITCAPLCSPMRRRRSNTHPWLNRRSNSPKHSERVTSAAGDAANPDRVTRRTGWSESQFLVHPRIGFNGIETYVRWGWVERKPGIYDWSYYDAILDEIEKHGLQWFPMLLAVSVTLYPVALRIHEQHWIQMPRARHHSRHADHLSTPSKPSMPAASSRNSASIMEAENLSSASGWARVETTARHSIQPRDRATNSARPTPTSVIGRGMPTRKRTSASI